MVWTVVEISRPSLPWWDTLLPLSLKRFMPPTFQRPYRRLWRSVWTLKYSVRIVKDSIQSFSRIVHLISSSLGRTRVQQSVEKWYKDIIYWFTVFYKCIDLIWLMPLLFWVTITFFMMKTHFQRIVCREVEAPKVPIFTPFQGTKKPRNYPWFSHNILIFSID